MRTEEIQQLLNKLPECGFAVKKSMHFVTLHFALGFFFQFSLVGWQLTVQTKVKPLATFLPAKWVYLEISYQKKLQSRGYQIFILLTTNSGLDSEGNVYIFKQKGKIKICEVWWVSNTYLKYSKQNGKSVCELFNQLWPCCVVGALESGIWITYHHSENVDTHPPERVSLFAPPLPNEFPFLLPPPSSLHHSKSE